MSASLFSADKIYFLYAHWLKQTGFFSTFGKKIRGNCSYDVTDELLILGLASYEVENETSRVQVP